MFRLNVRKFRWKSIVTKTKSRERHEKIKTIEENLRTLEQGLKNEENILNYNTKKEELSMIYDAVGNGIKVRNRCNWYKFREKYNKFFLNLEKKSMDVKIHYEILYQTSTMWQRPPGIKINKSNKLKVKNPAN